MEHLDIKKKIMIMIAVVSVLLFSALNMTIVGTALPKIVSVIGGLAYFEWVFTIYMVTSCITAILVGKLSDIYGRKMFLQIGIILFSLGSLLSGFSNDIIELIIYRGIQGFGGGMLMSISFATVGDLFSPRERGRWQGILGGTFGLASLLGPTLGGYIVDNFNWSWVFWVFLPFGIIAFVLITKLYPKKEKQANEAVDYFGSLTLTITIISFLLAISWAGSRYEWISIEIIGLFSVSTIALVSFIFIESKVKSPVVPLFLFKNSIFTVSNIVSFLIGIGMFSVVMYVPFFVQGVTGASATTSGLVELGMTIALVISSSTAGFLITKTGKYKIMAIIGLSVMAFGIYLNSQLTADSTLFTVVMNLVVIGLGLGVTFPVFNLTVQNAVKHKYLGVATATSQLFREIGGTVGVAIMGSIMGRMLTQKLQDASIPTGIDESIQGSSEIEKLQDPQLLMNPEGLAEVKAVIPEDMQVHFDQFIILMREALSFALSGVFTLAAIIIVLSIAVTLFLKEIPLRTSNVDHEDEEVLEKKVQGF